jgi:hypothetical protein
MPATKLNSKEGFLLLSKKVAAHKLQLNWTELQIIPISGLLAPKIESWRLIEAPGDGKWRLIGWRFTASDLTSHTTSRVRSTALLPHSLNTALGSYNLSSPLMDRLSIFSKSSSDLVTQNPWSSHVSVEPDGPKRRSFLSAVFTHGRSRSADARDLPPPAYETVAAPKRSQSSKYTSSNCVVAFSFPNHD